MEKSIHTMHLKQCMLHIMHLATLCMYIRNVHMATLCAPEYCAYNAASLRTLKYIIFMCHRGKLVHIWEMEWYLYIVACDVSEYYIYSHSNYTSPGWCMYHSTWVSCYGHVTVWLIYEHIATICTFDCIVDVLVWCTILTHMFVCL